MKASMVGTDWIAALMSHDMEYKSTWCCILLVLKHLVVHSRVKITWWCIHPVTYGANLRVHAHEGLEGRHRLDGRVEVPRPGLPLIGHQAQRLPHIAATTNAHKLTLRRVLVTGAIRFKDTQVPVSP
jgi:hypothetical protein